MSLKTDDKKDDPSISEIYDNTRYDGTTKDTWKNMSRKEKFVHFKEYYLKFVLIGIGFLLICGYIIYGMNKRKTSETFYCGMMNSMYQSPNEEGLFKDAFWKYLFDDVDYDGPRNLETMYFKSYDDSFESQIEIGKYLNDCTFDTIISNEKIFNEYANLGYYENLDTFLSDELKAKIEPYYVYCTDLSTGEKYPCGISISSDVMELYTKEGEPYENAILGVMKDSERKEVSIEFLEFLFLSNK